MESATKLRGGPFVRKPRKVSEKLLSQPEVLEMATDKEEVREVVQASPKLNVSIATRKGI